MQRHLLVSLLVVALSGCFESESAYQKLTSQCVGEGPTGNMSSLYGAVGEVDTYLPIGGAQLKFYTTQGTPPLTREAASGSNGCYNILLERSCGDPSPPGGIPCFYRWAFDVSRDGYEAQTEQNVYVLGKSGNIYVDHIFLEKG